jgi:hypothetical protein
MKTWIMFPLVAVAGCEYGGVYGEWDFSVAASSPQWVVMVANDTVCRVQTALPVNLAGQNAVCASNAILGCGHGETYDPVVVWDAHSNRFWYTALAAGHLCISAAGQGTQDDPLAITFQHWVTPDQFDGYIDRTQLAVGVDKVAVTSWHRDAGRHLTRVWHKGNFGLTDLIRHEGAVTLATPVGNAPWHLFWARPTANAMTIGRMTGAPGAGWQVESATIPASGSPAYDYLCSPMPDGSCLTAPVHGFQATSAVLRVLGDDLALHTATRVAGGTQLAIERWHGLRSAPFAPFGVEVHRVNLPPGGLTFACESLSVDYQTDRLLLAFTSAGPGLWPTGFLIVKPPWQAPSTPGPYLPGQVTPGRTLRLDYCPQGASFVSGGNYIGVGFQLDTRYHHPSMWDGKMALFCRQNGADLCTQ